VLQFAPYTERELQRILAARLHADGGAPLFAEPVLELIARRVAAASADVRRLLSVCVCASLPSAPPPIACARSGESGLTTLRATPPRRHPGRQLPAQ
jgi:hypothetical protein